MTNKQWFEIKNLAGKPLQVSINEEIGGWGVRAADFINEINQFTGADIELQISSPGGSFLDGLAIYHALREHPARVTGTVLSHAGSAASMVLMSCDHVRMPKNTHIMIHSPSGGVSGFSDDLREVADLMDRFENTLVAIYMTRFNREESELRSMVIKTQRGTWISAEEALAMGFADEVTGEIQVAALGPSFERLNGKLPEGVANHLDISNIKTVRDFETVLRDAGVSNSLASALASRAKTGFLGEPESDLAAEVQAAFAGLEFTSK